MNRRGEITPFDVCKLVAAGVAVIAAWFACAGLLGVFIGCAWRVAKWMQA